jgi:hypothetical protein
MRNAVPVLVALLFTGAAAAEDTSAPPAPESDAAKATAGIRLPPRETYRLFPQLVPERRVELQGAPETHRLLHEAGDPDSLFTIGGSSPEGEVHLKAAIEVNDFHLKAIPPDPLVQPNDSRQRSPGSFLPIDSQGHPYQLRLGARLVW